MYEFDEYIILTGVLLCLNDEKGRSHNLNAAAQISIAPFSNYNGCELCGVDTPRAYIVVS